MKLDAGYYKIKSRAGYFSKFHYLRVYIKNGKRYYQIDHGQPQEENTNEAQLLEGYEIVKKILNPIQVKNPCLTISFEDEDRDSFILRARNDYSFKRIITFFPRVAKALGLQQLLK